jgi:hypothetical protein
MVTGVFEADGLLVAPPPPFLQLELQPDWRPRSERTGAGPGDKYGSEETGVSRV